MLALSSRSEKKAATVQGLTVRGAVVTAGQSLEHVQYLTPSFVVTQLGASTILHCPELGGRFVVDRNQRQLRRVSVVTQELQIEHLRELVGTLSVHRDAEPVELEGFTCHRYRLCNDSARIVVAAEAFCTRIEAVGWTALQEERKFEAELHPFALPLEADEIIIQSTTRTFANGFQHSQFYRHISLTHHIAELEALEAFQAFATVEP